MFNHLALINWCHRAKILKQYVKEIYNTGFECKRYRKMYIKINIEVNKN